MKITVGHARSGCLNSLSVSFKNNFIYVLLFRVEFPSHRSSPCYIRGIMKVCLGPCISYHHFAFFQDIPMRVVMKSLTVYTQYYGE